jgi:hypothetical protein
MKEQYITMRNLGKYDIDWFYKYFLESGGKRIDTQTFQQMFQFVKLDDVLDYLDGKFNLISLHAPLKENQRVLGDFIKIVQ